MLNELSFLHYAIDPDEGINIADRALLLAKQLKDSSGLATAYTYKGHNYSALGRDSAALDMYDTVLRMHKRSKNQKGFARLTYNKGLIYFNQSNYYKANDSNRKAYEIFKAEKDTFLMAKMLNSMGINYMYLSQYPKALSSYLDAKGFYEHLDLTHDKQYASILSNIGLLYARLKNYGLAEDFQEKALELFKTLDFQEGIANALTNLGRLQTALGNSIKAIDFYERAYAIMQKNHNERGVASALTNMGIAYVELGEFSKAIPYFERTKTIYERLKNSNNLAIVHQNLGDCYGQLAHLSSRKENLLKAEKNYGISLDYAREAGSLNLQYEILEEIAQINTEKGDYRQAYENKTKAIVLKDSFNSVDKKEEIARLEAQYKYEGEKASLQSQFDKKQAVTKAEVEKQKTVNKVIAISAIVLLMAIGSGFLLYKKRNDAIAAKKMADFRVKVAETELKALRSQMNPHFIFNSLNSISDYMVKNDMETANEYLLKFSKLTRAILESSEKQWITLKEDLELTKLYIQLESLRLKNKLYHTIKVAEDMDIENILVPPLLLQPFIENSIWHGINNKNDGGRIDVQIREENGMVVCVVDDDGIGRKKGMSGQTGKSSMGIKITENRLDIIGELKRVKGNIEIIDKTQGLRVVVKLPLELRF